MVTINKKRRSSAAATILRTPSTTRRNSTLTKAALQFEDNKKFAIAQIWVDHAMGVASVWAQASKLPMPWGAILGAAGSAALLGVAVAQTALVNQQEYVPAYATGTNEHPGGMAIVGEQGPEMINLPRGTSVIPNARTMSMIGGQNGGNSFNFVFNNPTIDNKDRMNELVNRVEKEIGQRMKGRAA